MACEKSLSQCAISDHKKGGLNMKCFVAIGACYVDTILTVSHYPQEDHKLRASNLSRRRGGNCPNTLEVLQQLIALESTERASLHLITVLPGRHSDGTQYIQSSLQPFVDLDRCIYREAFLEPASSYVIRSQASDSRTIINYNQLPDMTLNDFIASCTSLQMGRDSWFHFEGRIPETTLQCISYIQKRRPRAVISVELEFPGRTGLSELSAQANIVFMSKAWAKHEGYKTAKECVQGQAKKAPKAYFLCCSWGDEGAAALLVSGNRLLHVPAYTLPQGEKLVDTLGAGDTFTAGILYSLMYHEDNWSLFRILSFANRLAGLKVRQEGFKGLGDRLWKSLKEDPIVETHD